MTTTALQEIAGGPALIEWFGRVSNFHDADLMAINLASKGASVLNLWTWQMTDKLDPDGYYVLEKHIFVDIILREVTYVSLSEFHLPGIVMYLDITKSGDEFDISWDGSYGVSGTLRARQVSIESRPGVWQKRLADWERLRRGERRADSQ